MKIDIHNGNIKIEGLNIKDKVLEVVEELKVKEVEKMKMTQEIMKKLVGEGYQWILNNPGKPYFTNNKLGEVLNYHFDTIKGVDPEPVKIEDAKSAPIQVTLESAKELLRIDGLKSVSAEMLGSIEGTMTLLKSVGKNVVLDIVFREV